MGLDMYLYRKSYVQNWNFMKPDELHQITVLLGGIERKDIKPERIHYIVEGVAYWRKANQIHKWFVDNCQGGEDDCRHSNVSVEQLAELVALCKQVLNTIETVEGDVSTGTSYANDAVTGEVIITEHKQPGPVIAQKELAEKLLPTCPGFFFGSYDYDEFYINDLKETVAMLEPLLLEEPPEGFGHRFEFEYHASW